MMFQALIQLIQVIVNVPTGLNNLKTKIYDLNVCELKTVSIDLTKLSEVVSKEVAKKTVYNKLNTKVYNLENEIPHASTLIQTN